FPGRSQGAADGAGRRSTGDYRTRGSRSAAQGGAAAGRGGRGVSASAAPVRFFDGPLGRLGELQSFASAGTDFAYTCGMTGHDLRTGRLVRGLGELPQALRACIPVEMVI